jgi:hypothetical protein
MFAALEGNLRAITRGNTQQRLLGDLAGFYSQEIPYPLDGETVATVSAAIRDHVTTRDEFDGGDTLDEWFYNHLLDKGAKELPRGAYEYDNDGKCKSLVTAENEKDISECFQDDAEFERFQAGKDYTKGFATIKDAEYTAHYGRMVKAIHKLVDSGQVQGGASLYLETVPIPFLQVVTLVEGEWLDRYVVVLAEVGAMLIDKGYQLQETNDHHPLAWQRFIDDSGSEVNQEEIHSLCLQVSRRSKRFSGRTKEIGGRPYINFEDYCSWQGRKVKDDLRSSVSAGFVTVSWNAWLDSKGTKRLAGVPADRLQCSVEEHDYLVCPDGTDSQLKRRALLLSIMSKASSACAEQEEMEWKQMAGVLLTKLYAFRQAITKISQRYFDGEEVLFPDLVRSFADLIKYTEELLVAPFNDGVAAKPEDKLDLEAFRQVAGNAVKEKISDLVNMAKAEALDAMGEHRAATELVERHVGV